MHQPMRATQCEARVRLSSYGWGLRDIAGKKEDVEKAFKSRAER